MNGLMPVNSFLGPQRPLGVDPEDLAAWEQRRANQQALELGMNQMFAQQHEGNVQGGLRLGATGIGHGVKALYPGLVRNAASTVMAPVKQAGSYLGGLGKQALGSISSYLSSSPVTLSTEAASTVTNIPASSSGSLLGSLGSVVGKAVPVLGSLYGAYSGVREGLESTRAVKEAEESGLLSDEQSEEAHGELLHSGLTKAGIGILAGVIGGLAAGPVGAVVGGVAGGAGGLTQVVQNLGSSGETGRRAKAGAGIGAAYGGPLAVPAAIVGSIIGSRKKKKD